MFHFLLIVKVVRRQGSQLPQETAARASVLGTWLWLQPRCAPGFIRGDSLINVTSNRLKHFAARRR